MEELNKIKMIERVRVAKFDHTHIDNPTEPFDVVVQETITEVSVGEAMLMGWTPKGEVVESSGTVHLGEVTQIGTRDGAPVVGD